MKIAVISRVFSRAGGGAESYSVNLVAQLVKNHEVHVFSQQSDHPVEGAFYHRVFCLRPRPRWINQLLFALATWKMTRQGFDVIHSHENTWHGQIQTVHVRPTRFNLLHGQHGLRAWMRWLKIMLSPRLLTYLWLEGARFKVEQGRHVVATSSGLLGLCELAYPQSKSVLSVITPGGVLPVKPISMQGARSSLGLSDNPPMLLFVANDYCRKGLDALLQALVLMPKTVELLVAGGLEQAPKYRQMADRLGLSARVHFVGSLNEMSAAYRAANCLVHPTLEDSFAMVVLEAMAHELPVVVSGPRHCGIAEHLTDGEQAVLLSDPRDAQALATRVIHVLQQDTLSAKLKQHGLEFAKQHSWEQAALKYVALYESVREKASKSFGQTIPPAGTFHDK
jgi:glycosyltransferase involved in cell wall biosynthesis